MFLKDGSMNKIDILGVKINSISREDALGVISGFLNKESESLFVATPNSEFIVESLKNSEFQKILNSADLLVPDGAGLLFAGSYLGTPFKERVAGSDLMIDSLEFLNVNSGSAYIVIPKKGLSSLEEIKFSLKQKYPNLNISGTTFDGSYNFVNEIKPNTLLLVGTGMIKQEKLIFEIRDRLPGGVVAMGIGGALDFITKKRKRAPGFFIALRLEWLWRIIRHPSSKRFKRIITATVKFPWLVFISKFKNKQNG